MSRGGCFRPSRFSARRVDTLQTRRDRSVVAFQFVVADISIPADSQHAQKERGENQLHAKKKPQRPEQHRANFVQRPKIAAGPLREDPGVAGEAYKRKESPKQQTVLELDPPQQALQRNRISVKALRITKHFGEKSNAD